MDAQRWRRVAAIFDAVVEVPAAERAGLLEQLCAGDDALRREAEHLLHADASGGAFEHGVHSARSAAAAAWADDADAVPAADCIGPWRVLRELGRGGMGVVYLAERADGEFEQRAALKLIKRGMDSEAVLARFRRERRILARLEHPHIAHLIDGGIAADGRPFFAMEYVDGLPLLRWCAERNPALEARIGVFLDVCAAVQFAHGQLVVHRDIKPSNILVGADGNAKLLDFGIGKLLDETGDGPAATIDAASRPLTVAYAAPEQLRGESIGTAADIYSLGAVLYELLCGERPYRLDDASPAADVQRLFATTALPPPSRVVADNPAPRRLRGDLDTIALTALQHEPERRYATVEALAGDLRRCLAGRPIAARRDQAWYRVRKFAGRHRAAVAATVLGVSMLLAAFGAALWQAREKSREAQVSQQVTQFLVGLFRGADPASSRGAVVTAQELLDQGASRLRNDTRIDATVRARLLQTAAMTYASLGLYDRAEPLAQEALALRRSDSASASADVAESLDELGNIRRLRADLAQAEPLLRESLAMRRALLPAGDPAILDSLDHVAALERAKGEFKEADVLYAEALHSAERTFGAATTETAHYIDGYAANLDDMGRRADALPLYRRALAIREQAQGADDAEVATSLLNLGVHLDESGNYDEAGPLLERALAIRQQVFGATHPLVGFAAVALAGLYEDLQRFDEAEALAHDALAIFRASLPPDHPKTGEALNLLAMLHMLRHDFVGAVPLAREVLARFAGTVGEDHPDTLTAKNNLAFALMHVGRFAEAEALLRDLLARKHADNGQGDAIDNENLAGALVAQGKFDEAVILDRHAVDIQRQREGEVSGNTAVALCSLALAEESSGAAAEAEHDLRAALAMGEEVGRTRAIGLYQWRIPLADFLVGADRCGEALPLLQGALVELADGTRRDPVWEPEARLLLGTCLARQGRKEGNAMQAGARRQLAAYAGIEFDLFPIARKLFAATAPPSRSP